MAKNKFVLVIAVIVAFAVGLGVGIFAAPHLLFGMHRGQFPAGGLSAAQVIGTPFSSFQFASASYLISGNATLSASGKVATDDFNTTATQLANGSTEYSLRFDETGAVYNITVGRGGKLYYIDTNLADDMPGADTSLGDDGYAVVNSTGYIVAFKYPLPNT